MYDEKGTDDKILCVPVSDPIWNKVSTLEEVNPHLKMEIEHFFQVYNDLEKKKVGIEGWEGKVAALNAIRDAQQRFQETQKNPS